MGAKENICRTCLSIGTETSIFFTLTSTETTQPSKPIREKIADCFPDLFQTVDLIPNGVICESCTFLLNTTYSFKKKYQEAENKIQAYIKSIGPSGDVLSLRKVIDYSQPSGNRLLMQEQQNGKVGEFHTVKLEPAEYNVDVEERALETPSEVEQDSLLLMQPTNEIMSFLPTHEDDTEFDALPSDGNEFLPTGENAAATCDLCNKCFYSKSNLTVHMRIHTGDKPYKCAHCKKAFTQRVYLIAHERIHTGEKPFQCTICAKSFAQKSYLRTHMIVHTGVRHHICKICGKGCAHTGDLNNHMRTHTGEKPYKCDTCGKCFTQSVHLKSHIKIHSGEKPFQCEFCDSKYTEARYLKKHQRNHHSEKPFKCECGKNFHEKTKLADHHKTHTNAKNFPCITCDKVYNKMSYLVEHMRTHTGEKPYRCLKCGLNFAYSQGLHAHLKVHQRTELKSRLDQAAEAETCHDNVNSSNDNHFLYVGGENPIDFEGNTCESDDFCAQGTPNACEDAKFCLETFVKPEPIL